MDSFLISSVAMTVVGLGWLVGASVPGSEIDEMLAAAEFGSCC